MAEKNEPLHLYLLISLRAESGKGVAVVPHEPLSVGYHIFIPGLIFKSYFGYRIIWTFELNWL